MASGHRAARPPARARAPPEGDQRGRRPARRSSPRSRAAGASPRTRSRSRAAAARKRRAEEGARAYAEEQRQRAQDADRAKHDPFASRVPDHSVVHRYARCLSYPEWGVGSVNGIYFTGGGDDIQQWARVSFQPGIRTVPAGSLQFVDFSKPDPGAERVQRFMTAAKHALAEGDFKLAARRLVFARDAEPANTQVLRLMTLAFWQAGDYSAAGRVGARLDPRRARASGAVPLRGADLRGHGRAVAGGRRGRARDGGGARATPPPGSGWGGCGCGSSIARARARRSSAHARPARPRPGLLDLALVAHLLGDVGAEVTRLRAGDAARAGVRGRLGALRARAGADRPRVRLPRGLRAGAGAWPTIPRCATCATRSRGWSRASCAPPRPPGVAATTRRWPPRWSYRYARESTAGPRRAGARDLGAGRSRRALLPRLPRAARHGRDRAAVRGPRRPDELLHPAGERVATVHRPGGDERAGCTAVRELQRLLRRARAVRRPARRPRRRRGRARDGQRRLQRADACGAGPDRGPVAAAAAGRP